MPDRRMRRLQSETDRTRIQRRERGSITNDGEGERERPAFPPRQVWEPAYKPIKPRTSVRVPETTLVKLPTRPVVGGARFPVKNKEARISLSSSEENREERDEQIWNSARPIAVVVSVVPVTVRRTLEATMPVPRETAEPDEERAPSLTTAGRRREERQCQETLAERGRRREDVLPAASLNER